MLTIMIKQISLAVLLASASVSFANDVSDAAKSIVNRLVIYDGRYEKIDYPNGDVSPNRGVCTDVVIRAYRKLDIDLQKLVHEDMKQNFSQYPSQRMWGLKSTDRNIDHRRVPNLEKFFERNGKSLSLSKNAEDYKAGDIVSWRLDNGLPHIGVVIDQKSKDGKRPLVVHNIGFGQIPEDVLFNWKMIGHYRYQP
ncbi:MAG: DUF1287 domain-containing protein, partial [Wohlfahrtiimonas sp.]